MIPRWRVIAQSLISIGAGGASGAVLPFFQQLMADGKFDHTDWHRVWQTAFFGAVTAVIFHFKTPPTEAKEPK